MIDFDIPADTAALRDQIRAFVTEKIVPYETDPRLTRHGPNDELRTELVELAREAGLLTFQAPQAVRRPRAVARRSGGAVRGGRLVDAGPDRARTAPPPTRATCSCWARSPTTSRWSSSWSR